jgi:hypothetical protein
VSDDATAGAGKGAGVNPPLEDRLRGDRILGGGSLPGLRWPEPGWVARGQARAVTHAMVQADEVAIAAKHPGARGCDICGTSEVIGGRVGGSPCPVLCRGCDRVLTQYGGQP